MAAEKIANFTAGGTPLAADRIAASRSPYATDPDDIYLTPANIKTFCNANPTFAAGTSALAGFTLTAGTNLTVATAGAAEYDGTVWYQTPVASNRAVNAGIHFISQNAGFNGTDVNTAQPMFNETAAGTITLPASTSYMLELVWACTRAAGTTAHTTATLFAGTATLTSIMYHSSCSTQTSAAVGNASIGHATAATAYIVSASSSSGTENLRIMLKGVVRTNGAGTLIPQFQYSAAPGGVPTILANSYFKLTPLGSNVVGSVGNWS